MGAIEDMHAPHKSVKIWSQIGAEKSGSEIDPY